MSIEHDKRRVLIGRASAELQVRPFRQRRSQLADEDHVSRAVSPIYEKASDAKKSIKVILFFTKAEKDRVDAILKRLKLDKVENVVLIDARDDNKPSGSKAG